MARKCKAKRKDGKRCRAYALPWTDYCFVHEPSLAGKLRQWRRVGGSVMGEKSRMVEEATRLKKPRDVQRMLAVTAERVDRGEIEPQTANAIGRVCSLLLKAMELTDLDERVDRLERVFGGDR